MLALLMPLSGPLGVLALPDAPLLLAALLCLDAFAAMLRRFGAAAAVQLALGLAIGAFSHYRFALVVLAGAAGAAVLCARARACCASRGLWLALLARRRRVAAAAALEPGHADAGLRFQFVDRHPWQLQRRGRVVAAGAGAAGHAGAVRAAAGDAAARPGGLRDARRRARTGRCCWSGLGVVLGFFALGFVSDSERVSFHWPLAGWLALACAAPAVLARWPRGARIAGMGGRRSRAWRLVAGYLAVGGASCGPAVAGRAVRLCRQLRRLGRAAAAAVDANCRRCRRARGWSPTISRSARSCRSRCDAATSRCSTIR